MSLEPHRLVAFCRAARPDLLIAKASDVDGKFHGEGRKNLTALFEAARRHEAVLFIDETDSLLSQRFASPCSTATPAEPAEPEDVARIEAAAARIDTARAPRMPLEAARR